MFLIVAMIVLSMPSKAFAANDTLTVFADGPALDEVINADTTTGGQHAHSVYKLVSLDTTYLYLGKITFNSDVTIMGVPGPDGRKPCIQPGILSSGSMPTELFILNANNMNAVFKNIYFYGLSIAGNGNWGKAILVSADYVRVTMDSCVVEENRGETIGYTGTMDKFFVTNCNFRNCVYPTDQFSTSIIVAAWPTSNPADSIVMRNNTIFCINGYAAAPGQSKSLTYFEFTHNTVVYNFVEPFIIYCVQNAKINNNLFYGLFTGAETVAEYPWWHQSFSAEIGAMISIDTLSAAADSVVGPELLGKDNARMLIEAKRNIEVKNNCFYQPSALTEFWKAWNDTATGKDSLYTPSWMDNRTKSMFANDAVWPGFVESGNVFVDPGFGNDLKTVLTDKGQMENVISLLEYVKRVRLGTSAGFIWGYKNQDVVSAANFVPNWPLPEASDMKYSNELLKTASTDGLPVGDYRWFGTTVSVDDNNNQLPSKFALSEAYPNPFNPSTNVKFSIAKAGNISLKVYNIAGELVKVVADNVYKEAGEYHYTLNMSNFSSGVYFYTLTQGGQQITKKLVLMK
jgi:hypothetical protein